MITRLEAIELAAPLTGLRDWPKEEAAVDFLIDIITRAATYGIAKAAIENWVEESNYFPKPSEMRALIIELNEEMHNRSELNKLCKFCRGRGIYGGEFVEYETLWNYCKCATGQEALRNDPGEVDRLNRDLLAARADNDRAIDRAAKARKDRLTAHGAGNGGLRPFLEAIASPGAERNAADRATAEQSLQNEAGR